MAISRLTNAGESTQRWILVSIFNEVAKTSKGKVHYEYLRQETESESNAEATSRLGMELAPLAPWALAPEGPKRDRWLSPETGWQERRCCNSGPGTGERLFEFEDVGTTQIGGVVIFAPLSLKDR